MRHAWLTDVIHQVHTDARGVYGAVRVHAELTKGLGIKVSQMDFKSNMIFYFNFSSKVVFKSKQSK